MDRRTIRTNQCWFIVRISFFGEFSWLFKRALTGKVMDVLETIRLVQNLSLDKGTLVLLPVER